MDQSPQERQDTVAGISVTPDMRPVGRFSAPRPPAPRAASRWPLVLASLATLVALASAGVAGWTYSESQRENRRIATELAQLRVSLDLYARNGIAGSATGQPAAELTDLSNRLAILEQNWRTGSVPVPTATTTAAAPPAPVGVGEDCLPAGMRILVAAGDSYPVCEQSAKVDVTAVDNGYIALADGTTVPSGGTMPLTGSTCTIGVTSNGDEGLTGYAEIRVNC